MDIYQKLPRPFFVLAPMDDVTDTVFRQIVADCAAADLYVTEFVNVDGLQSAGRDKLLHKLRFSPAEQPLIAQIWGKNPDNFRKTASELVEMGFSGVDINMGCPDKTIVKNGSCAALINNRQLATEIIKATKEGLAGRLPLSVKTRLGFNEVDLSWHEMLLNENLDLLAIHGRTKKEMSKVPANWELIGEIRKLRDKIAPKTLIIGNGDVKNRSEGLKLAKKHQLDGIMIGRGLFADPFALSSVSPWPEFTPQQRLGLYKKHIELFADTWQYNERRLPTLNKFCKIYVNGFDGAKELREKLMRAGTTGELLGLIKS